MWDEKEKKRLQIDMLLEEWKQNVALYIDQDKRGFQRITIYIVIHAGLLTFYSQVFKEHFFLVCVIAGVGFYLTCLTKKMSNRAHAYIHLRKVQGMLIENKLKELSEAEHKWRTSSGTITTFMRESVAFREHFGAEIPVEWKELKEEIKDLDGSGYVAKPFKKGWKPSMGHLAWLTKMYNGVYLLWALLALFGLWNNQKMMSSLCNAVHALICS